ncbi:alpha/beta fold hydrolase [Streptomyces sp. NRRL S-350]|uniref:alpha/beta fold hydrolase n=1 Tax=Streptomyces sp. NRRL S-350 TaxID=1463902 RepID=UPI00068D1257|nr:alpha/beta hydrolase [Streptomyces sp. NRRL S-350]
MHTMHTMRGRRRTQAGVDLRGLRGVQEAIAGAFAESTPGGVRPGELDLGGRALRWVEAGQDGEAPVVLIAGCGTSSLTWAPVLAELARHGRVVAYDRAGLGASEPQRAAGGEAGHLGGPGLDRQVDDLAALVRHLDAGPAVLVGHSWGGQLAQLLAWRRPELVAGLVLVDPAHEEFQPSAIRAAEAALNRLWLLRAALATVAPEPADPSARAEAAVASYPHQRRTVLAENRLTSVAAPEIRRRRSAARLPDVPVAVLSATEGLPEAMRSRWTALQSQIASAATRGTHIVVRGAGHAVHTDRPQAVTAAVLEVSDHARYFRNV